MTRGLLKRWNGIISFIASLSLLVGLLGISTPVTAAKDYNRVRIFLLYGAGSGTVWLDDVSLSHE